MNCRSSRGERLITRAFHIDHRHHLNLAWQRQVEEDRLLSPEALSADLARNSVLEIRNLRHLDVLLEAAGGRLVVLALYSTSCGLCKELRQTYQSICTQSHSQRARTVFLEHDVNDEFDFPSDLARYYRIRTVPKWFVFVDGALIRSFGAPDVRQVGGSRSLVQSTLIAEQQRLQSVLWELLVKNAPSARR